MKRAVLIALLVLSLMLALAACGQNAAVEEASAPAEEEGSVSMANPWREVTQEEAQAACTRSFNIPEGAENVKWSIMDAAADPSGVAGAMVQAVFDLNGMTFTAREQITGDTEVDTSGMHYQWGSQDVGSMSSWFEGMTCKLFRYVGDGESADLCTWYDIETGVSYSLSTVAENLDGFDITAVANAMVPTPEDIP